MIAVGNVLRRWREKEPTLAAVMPDGARYECRVETDPDAETKATAKSVLGIDVAASETRAVVPFRIIEDVTCSDAARLPLVVDAIELAFNGRSRLTDPEAAIHTHRRVATSFDTQAGLAKKATITWEVTASWPNGAAG